MLLDCMMSLTLHIPPPHEKEDEPGTKEYRSVRKQTPGKYFVENAQEDDPLHVIPPHAVHTAVHVPAPVLVTVPHETAAQYAARAGKGLAVGQSASLRQPAVPLVPMHASTSAAPRFTPPLSYAAAARPFLPPPPHDYVEMGDRILARLDYITEIAFVDTRDMDEVMYDQWYHRATCDVAAQLQNERDSNARVYEDNDGREFMMGTSGDRLYIRRDNPAHFPQVSEPVRTAFVRPTSVPASHFVPHDNTRPLSTPIPPPVQAPLQQRFAPAYGTAPQGLTVAQAALALAQRRMVPEAEKIDNLNAWTQFVALALSEQSGVTMRLDEQVKFFSYQQLSAGALVLHYRMVLTMGDTRVSGDKCIDLTMPTIAVTPLAAPVAESFSGISTGQPTTHSKTKTLKPRMPSAYGGHENDVDVAQWLQSMKLYLILTETPPSHWVGMAVSFLTGQANVMWFSSAHNTPDATWQLFYDTLCINHGDAHIAAAARAELKTLVLPFNADAKGVQAMGRRFFALLAKIKSNPGPIGIVCPIDVGTVYELWIALLERSGPAGLSVLALLGTQFQTNRRCSMETLVLWTSQNIVHAVALHKPPALPAALPLAPSIPRLPPSVKQSKTLAYQQPMRQRDDGNEPMQSQRRKRGDEMRCNACRQYGHHINECPNEEAKALHAHKQATWQARQAAPMATVGPVNAGVDPGNQVAVVLPAPPPVFNAGNWNYGGGGGGNGGGGGSGKGRGRRSFNRNDRGFDRNDRGSFDRNGRGFFNRNGGASGQ